MSKVYSIEYTDCHNQKFTIEETTTHLLASTEQLTKSTTGFNIQPGIMDSGCTIADVSWFRAYLQSKSAFMIPQIVTVMQSHRARWSKVKQELIKL